MKKFTGSLFLRLSAMVVLVVLTTQFFTLWMAAGERYKMLDKQLYLQVIETIDFLEVIMASMDEDERAEFLASYNRPGLPRLLPYGADKGVYFKDYIPRVAQSLCNRLSNDLHETVSGRFAVVGERYEFWVGINLLDQNYWLVIPFDRYSDNLADSILKSALIASLIATSLAFLMAWRITRPISRVVMASRQLASGTMPKAIPEKGTKELKVLARNFNYMAQALDNAARERRLMLAGLSHDLRTPLTRLKLMLELQESTQDQHDMLADIDELTLIVRQFIDFARAEETSKLESVALVDLANSVISRFKREGMEIALISQSEVELEADALALERLLSNLIENARRYGQPPVSIHIHQQAQDVLLSVRDHGKGIPEAFYETALAPFERLAEHRGTDGGSGLGLAIVSRIVKQHHGHLQFNHSEQDGFQVNISLPVKQPQSGT